MDNLVLLCRHHHRLVHEGGYSVQMSDQGIPEFTDPAGCTIPQAGEKYFRGNVFALTYRNHRTDSLACKLASVHGYEHGD